MARTPHRGPGHTLYKVEVQGANALAQHFNAMAGLVDNFVPQLVDVVADIGIERAKELVPVSDITEEGHVHTRDTINKKPGVQSGRGFWTIDFGPTTHYSPFLEYGTRFMAPRPFMIPAGDLAEAVLMASIVEFIKLLDTNTGGVGFGSGNVMAGKALGDPRVKGTVSGVRSLLYSGAKFLGDVSVFGGREVIGPMRGLMYSMAKSIGDVSSVVGGTMDTRISRRLSGRAAGRIAGYGSASFSTGTSYSAFPGGEGGRRIYQRSIGRATNVGISGVSFFDLAGR